MGTHTSARPPRFVGTHVITQGQLFPGERVEGVYELRYHSSGQLHLQGTWGGVYRGPEQLTVQGQPRIYHMFIDGHLNGVPQEDHGFPAEQLDQHASLVN